MDSLALFFSSRGRIARTPFAIAVVLVYVLIFASQLLLTQPITARANVIPFVLVQGLLTFAWYALHTRRLRDIGRGSGGASALAILYALSVVLFILLVELAIGTGSTSDNQGGLLVTMLVWLALGAVVAGMDAMSLFLYLAIVIMVLILVPLVIAIGFSLWAGTRPSAPVPP
jgi:uncharacterized membrane protein YhaH (DUF805 family)